MRLIRICFLLFLISFSCFTLSADPLHCTANDTITSKDSDPIELFKYLVGTWSIQGTWQVSEGQGKVKYTARAALTGTESYELILNGHFLERKMSSKLSYFSRDYGKKMNQNYSIQTIYSYNQNIDHFLSWGFDCSGAHLTSKGYYDSNQGAYLFNSIWIGENGSEIQTLHSIIYVNENEYRWEVQQKTNSDYEWSLAASGSAVRQKKL